MLETADLLIEKAKFPDWEPMYRNVWSHPESAKYMMWNVTTSEEDAKVRIQKTIEFQKTHDTYLVYERRTGEAIGFAGVEKVEPGIWEEAGICLGPRFVGRGIREADFGMPDSVLQGGIGRKRVSLQQLGSE